MGRRADAWATHQKALEIREWLVREYPTVVEFQHDLGGTLNNLAMLEMDQQSWDSARRRLVRAVECQRTALRAQPTRQTYRQFLWNHLWNLTRTCLALRRVGEAANAARELAELTPADSTALYDVSCLLSHCAASARGVLADGTGADARSAAFRDEAMEVFKRAIAAGWSRANYTARDPGLAALHDRADFRVLLAEMFDQEFPRNPFGR
jgi:hypothetical protein